jgi:hypothetical protein
MPVHVIADRRCSHWCQGLNALRQLWVNQQGDSEAQEVGPAQPKAHRPRLDQLHARVVYLSKKEVGDRIILGITEEPGGDWSLSPCNRIASEFSLDPVVSDLEPELSITYW